ncbi:hypothetical protein C8R43DRAFT_34776 [Mycena crocata]|nr:hypothetical protein C8R43DRAFT_34776 [Mycena crocata]
MPPDRGFQTKHLSQGERFAIVLGLADKHSIFHACKESFRRTADTTFNLELPLFQQQTAMKTFVQRVTENFPGFFNDKHDNNKERVDHLQNYARTYLEKSGKMTHKAKKKDKKPKSSQSSDALPSPPPSPDKSGIRNVPYPKPRPLHRKTPAPPVVAPIVVDELVDEPVPKAPVIGKVPELQDPKRAAASRTAPTAPTVGKQAAAPVDPLDTFLASCQPAMVHCASALRRAGVSEDVHLSGMAHWDQANLRNFLLTNEIAGTPLEIQAIIIRLEALK